MVCFTFECIQHVDAMYNIAKELQKDDGSGKKTAVVPTADQVSQIITNTGPVLKGLQDIATFANAKKEQFPVWARPGHDANQAV